MSSVSVTQLMGCVGVMNLSAIEQVMAARGVKYLASASAVRHTMFPSLVDGLIWKLSAIIHIAGNSISTDSVCCCSILGIICLIAGTPTVRPCISHANSGLAVMELKFKLKL